MDSDEFTNEKLLKLLDAADASSTGDTFCYFTNESLGISLTVPHVIGDQLQLEVKYIDVFSSIKTTNDIWKEIFVMPTLDSR